MHARLAVARNELPRAVRIADGRFNGLLGCRQAGRGKPLIHPRCRFGLSGPAQQQLACRTARWLLFGGSFESLGLFRQPLFKAGLVLDTFPLLGHAALPQKLTNVSFKRRQGSAVCSLADKEGQIFTNLLSANE